MGQERPRALGLGPPKRYLERYDRHPTAKGIPKHIGVPKQAFLSPQTLARTLSNRERDPLPQASVQKLASPPFLRPATRSGRPSESSPELRSPVTSAFLSWLGKQHLALRR